MIAQCKGKDLIKVPKSKLLEFGWISSIKYDGHYVQIHKIGDTVEFWTSGSKQFYIEYIAEELIELNKGLDFILETEYIADTYGKLGDRTKAAKLTTYRTNFYKDLPSGAKPGMDKFMVFDTIITSMAFDRRIKELKEINLGTYCNLASFIQVDTLDAAKDLAKIYCNSGYEGVFIKHKDHMYQPGKRLNTGIKIKSRLTADLFCIQTVKGEGKYSEMIGALLLKDDEGRIVSVGSGLTDEERQLPESHFVGHIIEIHYEQILDTYIQPTFVRRRLDK